MARGSWREQVAACSSANCSLHAVRPVPRSCMNDGTIDVGKVEEITARFDR